MPSFANETEHEPSSVASSTEEDVAALLVDCHDFVEQVLAGRRSRALEPLANQLLARLGHYVKWETLH